MSHSHENTLLSKLGGADPDRRNPLHDKACQYLCTQEVRDALCKKFLMPVAHKFWSDYKPWNFRMTHDDAAVFGGAALPERMMDGPYLSFDLKSVELFRSTASQEEAISKGVGQYKTTIGWIDVELRSDSSATYSAKRFRCREVSNSHNEMPPWLEIPASGECHFKRLSDACHGSTEKLVLIAEVKISLPSIGELLRQIRLYQEYVGAHAWLLVSPNSPSAQDLLTLRNHGISFARLGPKFDAWLADLTDTTDQVVAELEL